jgi:hypothetical protein
MTDTTWTQPGDGAASIGGEHRRNALRYRLLITGLWGTLLVVLPAFAIVMFLVGDAYAETSAAAKAGLVAGASLVIVATVVALWRYVTSSTTFDADGITMRSTWRTSRLAWSDVRALQTRTQGDTDATGVTVLPFATVVALTGVTRTHELPGVRVSGRNAASLREVYAAARPFASAHGVVLDES